MHVGDGPDPPPITVGTVDVEFVSFFHYLESTVTNKGNLNKEINWHKALLQP